MCTSRACKEAGVNTCRTKFSCYTELILVGDVELGEDAMTRGCTEFVYASKSLIIPRETLYSSR